MLGWAGKHTQGGACCLSHWILGCPLCCSPSSGPSLSPGVPELVTGLHQTPTSLQTAVGSTWERAWAKRSRKQQQKVPTACFGTGCTVLCQLAGATSQEIKPKEPASARPGSDPAPAAPCQVPACMKWSSHQKEQIQHFILNTWSPERGGRGRTHTSSLKAPSADTSAPVSCPVHRCHHGTRVLPKKPPGTWVLSFSMAGAEPKSHRCHQGEKNPTVRTSETKKDASLGCFFSINFFFFMKKDHTEFSNKQNAKKIVLNKT